MSPPTRCAVTGAVLILCLTAASSCKEKTETTAPDDVTQAVTNSIQFDAQILGIMHEANVGEITTGQSAIQRSANTDVRSFATTMVTEHATLDAQGTALAAQLGITPVMPNDILTNQQRAEVSQISAFTGTSFDQHYVAQQIAAHERTLALVEASIRKARQPAVRSALLNDIRPHIVQHLAAIQQISTRISP